MKLLSLKSKELRYKNWSNVTYRHIQHYISNGCSGSLLLSGTPITHLPNNLIYVEYILDISFTSIKEIPKTLKYVAFGLDIRYTQIQKLPNTLTIGSYLWYNNTPYYLNHTNRMLNESIPILKNQI